jgi:hypothetical protein
MRRRTTWIIAMYACGLGIAGWMYFGGSSTSDGPARAAMEQVIPVIRFRNAPLEQVLREFERVAGVPIRADWQALESLKILANSPVTLHRYDTTVQHALELLAHELYSDDAGPVALSAQRDHIAFTTRNANSASTVLGRYAVGDLLSGDAALEEILNDPVFGLSITGIGLFGPVNARMLSPYDRRRAQLIQLLKETIDPDSWRDNGGSLGHLQFVGDDLVAVQTVENHRQLANLLAELRRKPEYDWPGATWMQREMPALQALLDRRATGELRIDDTPLFRALDLIRESFRSNVAIDDRWLHATRHNLSCPTTIRLVRPTLRQALEATFARVHGESLGPLQFDLGENEVLVTGLAYANEYEHETMTYDLRPLLASDTRDAFDVLMHELCAAVEPDSWRDAGGSSGAIRQLYVGRAVITQTRGNHARIRQWLDARLAKQTTGQASIAR